MKKYQIRVCVKINEHQSEVITRTIYTKDAYETFWSIGNHNMKSIGDMLIKSDNIVYIEWTEI